MYSLASKFSKSILKTNLVKIPQRTLSGNTFRDKENAEEKMYFDKDERNAIKKLIKKMQAESPDDEENPNYYMDKQRLNNYFASNNIEVSEKLVRDLLRWKSGKSIEF